MCHSTTVESSPPKVLRCFLAIATFGISSAILCSKRQARHNKMYDPNHTYGTRGLELETNEIPTIQTPYCDRQNRLQTKFERKQIRKQAKCARREARGKNHCCRRRQYTPTQGIGQEVESTAYYGDERIPSIPNHELARQHGFHEPRSLSAADPPPYHAVVAEADDKSGVHEMA